MEALEQAHQAGVVVGLKAAAGVVPRLDIDVLLMEYPDTFNLLVMAFLEIMNEEVPWEIDPGYEVPHSDKWSFYQIAAVHGVPGIPWDGVLDEKNKYLKGYCMHSQPTFETWHRPYLAMLEQSLFRQASNIAERFSRSTKLSDTEKEAYREAAKLVRLPYFDYFRPRDYGRLIPGVRQPDIAGHERNTTMMTRVPYDFCLPQIFTMPRIVVHTLPDGALKAIRNPFYQFRLPPNAMSDADWKASALDFTVPEVKQKTLRYGSDKQRSVVWMNDNLNKLREDQLRLTLSLIEPGIYSSFQALSTNGIMTDDPKVVDPTTGMAQGPAGSLEGIHNDYHVYFGGFVGSRTDFASPDKIAKVGHMASVPVAAFDPVFWIHHCQIDRLFSIWQAVNPNSWFKDLPEDYTDEADQPLYPFRRMPKDGTPSPEPHIYWTPNRVRKTSSLGYTYPDIADSDSTPAEIRAKFVLDYAWSRRLVPGLIVGYDQKPPSYMEPLDISTAQVFKYKPGSTEEYLFEKLAPVPPELAFLNAMNIQSARDRPRPEFSYEWYIDDAVKRMAMNGSFTIFYIIELDGVRGSNGADWTKLPGFVGLTHVFAAPKEACDSCGSQDKQSKRVTSTTPITSLLIDYCEIGKLESMAPDHVEPFLIKNLRWRVQTAAGKVVNPREMSEVHKLRIMVSSKKAPLPGVDGEIEYAKYPRIVKQIIKNAGKT